MSKALFKEIFKSQTFFDSGPSKVEKATNNQKTNKIERLVGYQKKATNKLKRPARVAQSKNGGGLVSAFSFSKRKFKSNFPQLTSKKKKAIVPKMPVVINLSKTSESG